MEEKHPLVSVIMPVYNAEETVERAIRSVQSQTCPDWELLAVDDGSADGSGAVCDRCAHSRVPYAQRRRFPCAEYGDAGGPGRMDRFSGQRRQL